MEAIEGFLREGVGWPVIQSATGIDEHLPHPRTRLRQRLGAGPAALIPPARPATARGQVDTALRCWLAWDGH